MNWDPKRFIREKVDLIKEVVRDQKATVATSGGVDSVTCASLAFKALGEKLIVVFIDDGLMRENEPATVTRELRSMGMRVKLVKAAKDFFTVLKGVEDPEKKRIAFRHVFYETLGKVLRENGSKYLIQGTIKADISETKRGIKTQHNVLEQIGINPRTYGLDIIEPLKELLKPQVREVARTLGLPKEVYERMPFPGPGLATRIIGEVTPSRVKLVRKATSIVEQETKNLKPFQAFAVLLRDKATGVVEGRRVLGEIVAIRSVESKNALTASFSKLPWEVLERIQRRITREIPQVTKVLYDITPKPPSTIEYI